MANGQDLEPYNRNNHLLESFLNRHPRFYEQILQHKTRDLIVSVSGGRDSMLLLAILHRIKEKGELSGDLIAFHMNHCLREDANLDEGLIEKTCEQMDIPLFLHRIDVGKFHKRTKLGIESSGRILRYRALGRLVRRYPGAIVVTGHQGDDYVESVLMHMVRGGGASSRETMSINENLSGLHVFRPMLVLTRMEIHQAVLELDIPYREDRTNESMDYLRNRIRARVLPLLLEEGLHPVTLWDSYHPEDSKYPMTPGGGSVSFLRVDPGMIQGANVRDVKMVFDGAFRALGCAPVTRAFLHEFYRQWMKEQKIHFTAKDALIYGRIEGEIFIIRKDSSLFRSPGFIQQGDGWIIQYGGESKRYPLREGMEPILFQPGMKWAYGDAKGKTRRKDMKKIFQELSVPPELRGRIPLIRHGKSGLICGVLVSFLGQTRDRWSPYTGE